MLRNARIGASSEATTQCATGATRFPDAVSATGVLYPSKKPTPPKKRLKSEVLATKIPTEQAVSKE